MLRALGTLQLLAKIIELVVHTLFELIQLSEPKLEINTIVAYSIMRPPRVWARDLERM